MGSILPRATIGETRHALSMVADPTPAETDGSPIVAAALLRRFGIVESPYVGSEYARMFGSDAGQWYAQCPEACAASVRDAMQRRSSC